MAKKHKTAQKVGKGAYGAAALRAASKHSPHAHAKSKPKAPAAASQPAAPAAPAAAPPAQPALVNPYFSPADLQALNDFTTNYATNLTNIDSGLASLATDTDYQKTQVDTAAKEQTSSTQDNMAARGLFRSSVKDAALYDVEASRSLQTKFLNDKLNQATLNAGTQKKILGDSKKRFDEAMMAQQVQNAQTTNDALGAAWADQMATYNAAHPPAAAAKPSVAAKPAAPRKPSAPRKPAARPRAARVPGSGGFGRGAAALGRSRPQRPNTAQGAGRAYRGN